MKNNQNKPILGFLPGTNGKFRTVGAPVAERALARKQNRELIAALNSQPCDRSNLVLTQLAADEEAQALQDHFPYTLLAHDRYSEVDAAQLKLGQRKHKA